MLNLTRIADESVYELCDLVCGKIALQLQQAAQKYQFFFTAE